MLDAARARGFTGELEFGVDPVAHVYLERGEVYLAECEGDPPIGARLVAAGVLEVDDLDAGSVEVAGHVHLGRLFERVPWLDQAAVMVALEVVSGETVAWVAAQTTAAVVARPYVHHPSGVNRWYLATPPIPPQLPAPLAPQVLGDRPVRGWRPPVAPPGVADEVRIDWLDDDPRLTWAPPSRDLPVESTRAGSHDGAVTAAQPHGSVRTDPADADFELVWPSGEVEVPRPAPSLAASLTPPDHPFHGAESIPESAAVRAPVTPDAAPSGVAPADTEQIRLAVRRTIAAIESGLVQGRPIDPVVPVPDTGVDPFEQWRARDHPDSIAPSPDEEVADPWPSAPPPAPFVTGDLVTEDPFDGWGLDPSGSVATRMPAPPPSTGLGPDGAAPPTPRRGTLAERMGPGGLAADADGDDDRQTALRRLIDDLRGR